MITINHMNASLDLDVFLNDLLSPIRQHQSCLSIYSYRKILSIRKHIGALLGLDKLIFYSSLCKALITEKQRVYAVKIPVHDMHTLNEIGLYVIKNRFLP